MTPADVITFCKRPFWRYAAGAFLVFFLGFFLFHGKLAAISGSWKYIMRTTDDDFYWASAKGATEVPICEGNPYYVEEIGKGHAVPYPIVTLTGWIAKILGVSVLFFFPIWHIGMPWLLWFGLYVCFTKFWRCRAGPSAALALMILLSTLFVCDVSHQAIFRYSRPGDALWLLFIWIAWVMKLEQNSTRAIGWLWAISFLTFWLNPFLAILGIWVTLAELLWQAIREKNKAVALRLGTVLAAGAVAAVCYGIFVHITMSQNSEVLKKLLSDPGNTTARPEWSSMILYVIVAAAVLLPKKLLKYPFGAIDRLVLIVIFIEPLLGNLQVLIPEKMLLGYHRYQMSAEFAYHRYAYYVIEIAAITGWLIERLPVFLQHKNFRKYDFAGAAGLLIVWGVLFNNSDLNFFRYAPNVTRPFSMPSPLVIMTMLPFLVLAVWTYFRFDRLRKVLSHPYFTVGLILVMALGGYPSLAWQSYDPKTHNYNFRDFPFDGAYQWLAAHGQKNEVVLTVPPSRLDMDYLGLYTPMKTYIHPFGSRLADRNPRNNNTFKFLFYFNLLVDDLKGFTYHDIVSMEDKLKYAKLDYILVEKSSPFAPHTVNQIKDYFVPVYSDDRCILFKLLLRPAQ